MSSPPDTPKQKKGIRQLLKESFRSRSRSPSQSLLQPDLGAPSVTPVFDEGAALMANPSRGAPPDDSATTATRQTNISYVGASERAGGVPRIPIIVEPVDPSAVQLASSPEITVRSGPTVTNTPSKHTRNDPPELSIDTLERSTTIDDVLVDTEPNPTPLFSEHTPRSRGTSEPQPVLPTTILGDQGQRSRNPAWNGLRGSLRFLRDSSSVFPQLSLAIESLLSCLDGLEVAVQNRQEFEDLATELTTLSESLRQHMSGSSSMLMSGSTASVAMAIERQAIVIRERLAGVSERGMRGASMDEEELVKHYRKVQSHFRQLQTNASMSTWSIVNEHLVNTRLEGLSPTKQATYDSSLSTQISRRGCTEGTRIGVLDGLEDWLYDSTSSSIYWMNGMAGTGKTTIASTFCERIERRKLLAASFFCTRSSADCRNVTRIVPTIAYQLARYSIPFQSALCNILGQNPDIGSKNVLKQFEQLLKEPLQQIKDAIPDSLVVVIDALDECDDRNGVELVLDMLFRHAAHVPLKFLLTSRPEPEIYSKMASHARSREVIHLHDIEKSLVRADIELYLKEELGFMSPPASQLEIEQLVERAGALFIYAATLVRYIRSGKRLADPHKRLRSVLGLTPESTKKYTQIDALYTAVLRSALNEDELEADETEDIRVVLRTVLFAQEPITVETIAALADIDDPQSVIHALHPLRSVLHQSEETGLVSTLHASFPDFMFSNERSGSYFYDVMEHSQLLARRCFLVMKDQLRFNICDLASSFVSDKEVDNIEERIKSNISPTLAYACRFWPSHLTLAPQASALLTLLDEFLCHRLLFWMEVLSLRGEMPVGINGLFMAQQWLAHAEFSPPKLIHYVDDARSFVTSFAVNPTSQSTPHIYLSSLSLCPYASMVHQHYGKRSRGLLELKGSLMEVREGAPLAVWNVGLDITAFALSPDGTRVAIGCRDTAIYILSAYDGTTQIGPLQGHIDYVSSVAFSLDGGRVVAGSRDGITVWNAHNGIIIAGPFTGYLGLVDVSFSPDGQYIVSGGYDRIIRVRNARNGIPLWGSIDHGDVVYCVRISANGALIAAPSSDYNIQLWNLEDGTPAGSPLTGHTGLVQCLAFTPCSTRLVSGSRDQTVRVWNISDGSLVTGPFEAHTNSIDSIAISPDGLRVASSDSSTVQVWKINDGTLVAGPFYGVTPSLRSMSYSPDGTRIIFSGSRCIYVRSVRDSMFPPPPPPPQDAVMQIGSVSFCPDNVHFLSGDVQCTIRVWDSSSGSFITSPNKAKFFPTPFCVSSPDGSLIVSRSESGDLQFVNTTDGSLVAGPYGVERSSLSNLSFARNSRAVIMGCLDGSIKVCDLRSKSTTIGSFVAHHKRVSSVSESPDCSLLVSHSDDEMAIRVWRIADPALDIQLFSSSIDPASGHSYAAVYDGWAIREDGWAINNSQHLLFWLPPDLATAWCSPYATLVITKSGTLQVEKQRLFVGNQWTKCYVPA